jgi:transposase
MFVRSKTNLSGSISVQVIEKSGKKMKLLKTIGNTKDLGQVAVLEKQAQLWIQNKQGLQELDFNNERGETLRGLLNISQIRPAGASLILGKIFDEIGFNTIDSILFRQLVIARICFPASKLKTTDYLSKYQYFDVDVHVVYRYLDKLYTKEKQRVQQISYEHTCKILNDQISVVFYDVTTLYFESDNEDELRQRGFSKDGKHQNPQIVLGLLVSIDGYPLAYDIFEGKKFEGHTMLPVINGFKHKYHLEKLVVIADSGLLSRANVEELIAEKYEFILGGRIKNEPNPIKEKILKLKLGNGESEIIEKGNGIRLIVSYSDSRATKDRFNRERGLAKLEKKVATGNLTKSSINNRGYNKFLKLKGSMSISIDEEKIIDDAKWDGLKGYITNTDLSKADIITNYKHLWKIEKAFRISKHDLKVRPIYHRLARRIESHICIAFTAYKVYKELERQLKEKKASYSPESVIDIAKTIYTVEAKTPSTNEYVQTILLLSDQQREIAAMFDL